MRSGSSAWVIATRESIVGVSEVTDSVVVGRVSTGLEAPCGERGGAGGVDLGGGVGGVNYR